jgi:single-stranded-DNA-specific exonuclease
MRDFLDTNQIELVDPYRLRDMTAAVERILHAIRQREVICVYGDFDADGVTATALLVTALQSAGARVGSYIPDRVDEGYGLHVDAIERIARTAQLIVTVDCGMRSSTEVRRAMDLGLDVIITDHHTVGPELPPALAVINPRRSDCTSRFDRLAGVGVAYRLAQAVLRAVATVPGSNLAANRAAEIEMELLDLVALGTVADMMPLLDENRRLVRRGLERLSNTPRTGLSALIARAGVSGAVDATAISFRLAPRINAAGRLSNAKLAYDLLRTNDHQVAFELAGRLEQLNQQRQSLVQNAQAEAMAQVADNAGAPLLFVRSTEIRSGIVGLVAGKLTETYYRPAVVIEEGPVDSRGSARSIREFDISSALDEVRHLLVRHGGHSRAAGFTVRTAALDELAHELTQVAERELSPYSDLRPTLEIDAVVSPDDLTWDLAEQFARLEPTGQDNPTPILLARNLRLRSVRAIGDGKHLRLVFNGDREGSVLDAVAFNQAAHLAHLGEGMPVDAVFTLETNEFNGRRSLQLNIRDMQSNHQPTVDFA